MGLNPLYIYWLDNPICQDQSICGNKTANLARILNEGYNVPYGFCVSTVKSGKAKGYKSRELINEIEISISKISTPWVVRSSSSVEDSQSLSFAGLFDSYIGLKSIKSVKEALVKVLESKNNKRLTLYANHNNIATNHIRVHVLIQSLINSEYSGIAFSNNPYKKNNSLIIEANFGLPDTVVDGSVTPDHIEMFDNNEIKYIVGTKKQQSTYKTDVGLNREEVSLPRRGKKVLTIKQIIKIADTVRNLENLFQKPQDVEWAFYQGELFILQTRPITKLPL